MKSRDMEPESSRRKSEAEETQENDSKLTGEFVLPVTIETSHDCRRRENRRKPESAYPNERPGGDLSTKCQLYFPHGEVFPSGRAQTSTPSKTGTTTSTTPGDCRPSTVIAANFSSTPY